MSNLNRCCCLSVETPVLRAEPCHLQEVLRKLSYTASGEISPIAAMFGGVVGQEVMKAASGKFHPLFQWFYFDSIESLPDDDLLPEHVAPQV